jgi:hypothetical protein
MRVAELKNGTERRTGSGTPITQLTQDEQHYLQCLAARMTFQEMTVELGWTFVVFLATKDRFKIFCIIKHFHPRRDGGTGRRSGLKIRRGSPLVGVQLPLPAPT